MKELNMSEQRNADPASAVIAPEIAATVSGILQEKVGLAVNIEKHNRLADEHDVYAEYHRARARMLGVEYDRAERRIVAAHTVRAAGTQS